MAATANVPASIPPLDERELRAWRGMLRAHAALTKALDAELESVHGLPLSSYEVLLYLNDAEDGRMRMRDLATSVILSRSGLTRLVDRLEREGLIRRESCPSDARGAYAVLTAAGARKLADARSTHLAGIRTLFLSRFSAEELELLAGVWERVMPGVHAGAPSCG
jgi:DNA-binding MarR family transcriptional regulator